MDHVDTIGHGRCQGVALTVPSPLVTPVHAAASGLRAPVQVIDGNYTLLSGTCPWWDGVRDRG